MTPLLDRLLGSGSENRQLAEEMRAALQEMQRERARFERLVEGANTSAERLQQLGEPIEKAGSDMDAVGARLGDLEQRFAAMVQLAAHYQTLDERAEALAHGQERAEAQVASLLEEAQHTRSAFEEIGHRIELALGLKDRLENFLEVEKPFDQLRGEADGIRAHVEGTGDQLARLREQHDRLLDAHKLATSKVEALDRRREELSRDLQDKERRVASVEQSLRGMDGVQHTVDDVRRELGTLKALGDFVAQKSAALEAQRESIENALARAEHLDRAVRQIDAGVRQQQENEKTLGALQDQVAALQALHESVVERSREIAQLQREAGEQAQSTRQDLAGVRDEMKNTVGRFDFEAKSLESVSQRVADLRGALADFENRFKGVSESSVTVAGLASQTQAMTAQLQALVGEAARIDEELGKLQGIRRDLDETARTAREAAERVDRIEAARPSVEVALRDIEHLGGASALVKDALEQARIAHGEIARAQETQSETRSWLAGVEQSVRELDRQVGELRGMAPTLEVVLKDSQRIGESMAVIESRREFVEDLHRRLADLGALSTNLDVRGRQLQTRMEAAEQRFVGLGEHAEEAERISKTVASVTASVDQAGREADAIGKTVTAMEARCESVEALAERTRALREEIQQRHHALDEAARDLERSSELRQEAAASVQQLDELSRRLTGALSSADQRLVQVDALSTQLEDRANGLQVVEKRLSQFEERLAKWERVEQEIARALEQITARQGTVESLQADLDRMFTVAEKTAKDVRAITSAQREVEESRGLLDDVRGRLREVRDTASALDERKRQMARAEERLARADALLVDVRSSLEVLEGQKVIVDHAVEKAGTLRFLLKQAEATIEGLREEREMTARVQAAVAGVRREDDVDGDEGLANAA